MSRSCTAVLTPEIVINSVFFCLFAFILPSNEICVTLCHIFSDNASTCYIECAFVQFVYIAVD